MTAAADQRRGFCPTVFTPMESGDGLIVRLGVGVRRLRVEQLRQLAELAQSLGNGLIELTRRGKLQLRGVEATKLAALQSAVTELGLAERSAHDRRAALVVCPLSGLHPTCADLDALTAEIELALSASPALSALPDKFGIVVDSGGYLSDITADIRLDVFAERPELCRLSVAHDAHSWIGRTAEAARAAAELAVLLATAKPASRMRDLVRERGPQSLERCLEGWQREAEPAPSAVDRARRVGFQRGSRDWLALGVPFGSGDAPLWQAIAELVADFGAGEIRITPWRSVILPGVSERDRSALSKLIEPAGLIADPEDPLLRAVACSGAPACRSALGETRRFARELGRAVLPRLRGQARLHVSGCGKSCALDGRADVTLVWDAEGCKLGLDQSVSEATKTASMTLEAARARLAELPAQRDYERDGAAIYQRSFAIIRAEADLERFSPIEERVAVRLIHASGMVELARDIEFSPGFAESAVRALNAGAPILCDTKMLPAGVTRPRLPANNEVLCFLDDPRVVALAAEQKTTRSAAALSLWREKLDGAVVAVGNAPTALFRLLEIFDETPIRPAAVIGVPVGFVGAAESKEALLADGRVPCMIVRGRKGGSAMAVAAINALASDRE
jgi:precorrin-3B synthase